MTKTIHADCNNCPLKDQPFVPTQQPAENKHNDIVLVGEAPGAKEAETGLPFVGRSGQLLTSELKLVGIDRRYCVVTNAVLCRPPDNDLKPYKEAIQHCNKRLLNEINATKPDLIIGFGNTAIEALAPELSAKITRTRGKKYSIDPLPAKVLFTFHPAALLYHPSYLLHFRQDLQQAVKSHSEVAPTEYTLISPEELYELLQELPAGTEITCDTETSSLIANEYTHMLCIQFSFEAGHSYIVTDLSNTELLTQIFSLPLQWAGHNFMFDAYWVTNIGIQPPKPWLDTMLLSYIVSPEDRHGLKHIAQRDLGVPDWEADIKQYVPNKKASYADIPKDKLYQYAASDTDYNLQILPNLLEQLTPEELDLYYKILQPAQQIVTDIKVRGWQLDIMKLQALLARYEDIQQHKIDDIKSFSNKHIQNPNSTKQVGDYLFTVLALPVVKYTPKGAYSTDNEVLQTLQAKCDLDIIDLLVDYRKFKKVKGTYVEGLLKLADSSGVLHPDINLMGTVTGRLSAGTALTIPRVGTNEWAAPLRDMFISRPGYTLVAGDYAQAELRVITCEAKERVWRNAILAGLDLHSATAQMLFGKDFTPEQRVFAKTCNFGLAYGMGASTLAKTVGWPIYQAEQYLRKYKRGIPNVVQWQNEIKKQAALQGVVTTRYARKRNFVINKNTSEAQRAMLFRQAINFVPQSVANDLTMLALIDVYQYVMTNGYGYPLLMLHDGIYFEVLNEHVTKVKTKMKHIMERVPVQHYSTYVPFTADVKVGKSWGELDSQ